MWMRQVMPSICIQMTTTRSDAPCTPDTSPVSTILLSPPPRRSRSMVFYPLLLAEVECLGKEGKMHYAHQEGW
jgi:hypothetical protein